MVLYVQVVGNLIYYRYMNPAIVAPDAFDIVSLGVDKGLTPDQVQHTQLNIVNLIKSLEINHLLRYSAEFKIWLYGITCRSYCT